MPVTVSDCDSRFVCASIFHCAIAVLYSLTLSLGAHLCTPMQKHLTPGEDKSLKTKNNNPTMHLQMLQTK